MLYLQNNTGRGWLGPVTPGVAGGVENGPCIVNAGGSSALGSGNNPKVNVALTFKAEFAGAKTNFLFAQDNGGLSSPWRAVGTWAVPRPRARIALLSRFFPYQC